MEAQPSPQTASRSEAPEVSSLRAIVSKLRAEGRDDDAFEHSFSAVQAVLNHVRLLELKILAMRKAAVGKTSERVDNRQLALLLRGKYLVDVQSVTKVEGMAFLADEVESIIDAALDGTLREKETDKAKLARAAAATVDTGVGANA